MKRFFALTIAALVSLSLIEASAGSLLPSHQLQQEGINHTPLPQQPLPYREQHLRLAQDATRECPADKNGKPYCGNNCPLCR